MLDPITTTLTHVRASTHQRTHLALQRTDGHHSTARCAIGQWDPTVMAKAEEVRTALNALEHTDRRVS